MWHSIWHSTWRLRSSSTHCDQELGGEEEKKKKKEEEEEARRVILKSNNPLLASGEKDWALNSKARKSHPKIFEQFSQGRLETRRIWETLRHSKKPDVLSSHQKKIVVIWCSVTWRCRFKSASWVYLSQGWTPPLAETKTRLDSLYVFVCHPIRKRGQLRTSAVLEIPRLTTKFTSLAQRLRKHSHQPIWHVSCDSPAMNVFTASITEYHTWI